MALQQGLPPRWRGLDRVALAALDKVRPGRRVHLILPVEMVLDQTLDVPAGGTSPGWLSARVEGLSPWAKDACLWDARPVGAQMRVAIVPLRPVQQAEREIVAKGAMLAEVVSGPYRFRTDLAQVSRWRDRILLAVGLVCGVALGLAGLGVQLASAAQDRAALAEASLTRTSQRLKDSAGPAQAALALLPRKRQSVALALAYLAGALPLDSYLTTLSLTADTFELSGQSAKPEGIIPALAADNTFVEVDFAGPAAHDPDTGSYSFNIKGKWGVR